MAAGAPVVTSNVSAMPEVSGDAAVLVDPLSVDSIANGIEEAIANRAHLISAGETRARQYSWDRTAELTMAVYRELV